MLIERLGEIDRLLGMWLPPARMSLRFLHVLFKAQNLRDAFIADTFPPMKALLTSLLIPAILTALEVPLPKTLDIVPPLCCRPNRQELTTGSDAN